MEIERKWMVNGWPEEDLPLLARQMMRQGYLTVRPTVRIREETFPDQEIPGPERSSPAGRQPVPSERTVEKTSYILCFKTGRGIVRREIELEIPRDKFLELEEMIGRPLIPKERRTYLLPDGLHLEVNHVDEGAPTEFWYAEIEFDTEDAARNWQPSGRTLRTYLSEDVSEQPGQSMGEYWEKTRGMPV